MRENGFAVAGITLRPRKRRVGEAVQASRTT